MIIFDRAISAPALLLGTLLLSGDRQARLIRGRLAVEISRFSPLSLHPF